MRIVRGSTVIEKRKIPRTRISKAAKLIFDAPFVAVIDCTVRNVTSRGAGVKLSAAITLPDTFELSFDSGRTCRRCELMWRVGDEVGISFLPDIRLSRAQ